MIVRYTILDSNEFRLKLTVAYDLSIHMLWKISNHDSGLTIDATHFIWTHSKEIVSQQEAEEEEENEEHEEEDNDEEDEYDEDEKENRINYKKKPVKKNYMTDITGNNIIIKEIPQTKELAYVNISIPKKDLLNFKWPDEAKLHEVEFEYNIYDLQQYLIQCGRTGFPVSFETNLITGDTKAQVYKLDGLMKMPGKVGRKRKEDMDIEDIKHTVKAKDPIVPLSILNNPVSTLRSASNMQVYNDVYNLWASVDTNGELSQQLSSSIPSVSSSLPSIKSSNNLESNNNNNNNAHTAPTADLMVLLQEEKQNQVVKVKAESVTTVQPAKKVVPKKTKLVKPVSKKRKSKCSSPSDNSETETDVDETSSNDDDDDDDGTDDEDKKDIDDDYDEEEQEEDSDNNMENTETETDDDDNNDDKPQKTKLNAKEKKKQKQQHKEKHARPSKKKRRDNSTVTLKMIEQTIPSVTLTHFPNRTRKYATTIPWIATLKTANAHFRIQSKEFSRMLQDIQLLANGRDLHFTVRRDGLYIYTTSEYGYCFFFKPSSTTGQGHKIPVYVENLPFESIETPAKLRRNRLFLKDKKSSLKDDPFLNPTTGKKSLWMLSSYQGQEVNISIPSYILSMAATSWHGISSYIDVYLHQDKFIVFRFPDAQECLLIAGHWNKTETLPKIQQMLTIWDDPLFHTSKGLIRKSLNLGLTEQNTWRYIITKTRRITTDTLDNNDDDSVIRFLNLTLPPRYTLGDWKRHAYKIEDAIYLCGSEISRVLWLRALLRNLPIHKKATTANYEKRMTSGGSKVCFRNVTKDLKSHPEEYNLLSPSSSSSSSSSSLPIIQEKADSHFPCLPNVYISNKEFQAIVQEFKVPTESEYLHHYVVQDHKRHYHKTLKYKDIEIIPKYVQDSDGKLVMNWVITKELHELIYHVPYQMAFSGITSCNLHYYRPDYVSVGKSGKHIDNYCLVDASFYYVVHSQLQLK